MAGFFLILIKNSPPLLPFKKKPKKQHSYRKYNMILNFLVIAPLIL